MVWIQTSIFRAHNTFAQFIATRPILDLCEQATWWSGARVAWRWWEQKGMDLKGAWEKAAAALAETEMKAISDSESEDEAVRPRE